MSTLHQLSEINAYIVVVQLVLNLQLCLYVIRPIISSCSNHILVLLEFVAALMNDLNQWLRVMDCRLVLVFERSSLLHMLLFDLLVAFQFLYLVLVVVGWHLLLFLDRVYQLLLGSIVCLFILN